MAQKIKMTVPRDGISQGKRQVTYETEGFQGETCKTATEAFERALGTTTDDQNTSEFYQTEERHEYLQGGSGSGG